MMSNELKDPISVAEVKSSPDKLKWEKAIESEMKSLCLNEMVWFESVGCLLALGAQHKLYLNQMDASTAEN